MTQRVDLIIPPAAFQLVEEQLASWGGEAASFDPPRYRYSNLSFKRIPVATYLHGSLPKKLRTVDSCLGVDAAVVASLALPEPSAYQDSLGKLLANLDSQAGTWALVCDADIDDEGPGWRDVIAQDRAPSVDDVRKLLQVAVKNRGLTIFVVEPKR